MDTFREGLQNLIDIIALQIYVFGTLWPANTDFRAMIRYEYSFDSLRIPPPVTMFFVLVIIIAFVLVAVIVPSYNNGIGLYRFGHIRVPRRYSLKPDKFFGADRDGGNVTRTEVLSRQHNLLVAGDALPTCPPPHPPPAAHH